jgi:hypothetical protein
MKQKIVKVVTIIGILSLLPLFMGQEDCENSETLKQLEVYNQLIKQIEDKLPPPPGQSKTYISFLSFMDAETQSTIAQTEEVELIENAIAKLLNEVVRHIPILAVNEPGHMIPNTDEIVNKMINITFTPDLTKNEKVNKIIDEIMTPNHVDVIVTGQYIDDCKSTLISLRPVVIVKAAQKIVTKNLQFSKDELFCEDPIGKRKKILCSGAHDQLAQAFHELIKQL